MSSKHHECSTVPVTLGTQAGVFDDIIDLIIILIILEFLCCVLMD